MKKILLLLLLASTSAFAQHFTTDKVVVIFDSEDSAPLTLNGTSSECYFTVRLEGGEDGRIYNGYQMDIHLPDGMTVMSNDGELELYMAKSGWTSDGVVIYPFTEKRGEKTYKHSVDGNMISANTLRVGCLSQTVDNFTATSGDLFHVYVQTSAYMKPGDVKITIDNVVLNANEITQGDGIYHAVSYKPSVECGVTISGVSGDCSLNFNVSGANHWSTCVLPFSCDVPSGVVAYSANEVDGDNNLLLTRAESFEAYTPYILYSENGYSSTLSGTVDPALYPEDGFVTVGKLNGAIAPQQVTEGFVLQKLNDVVKFYSCNNGTYNIPAGKCWVSPLTNEARSLSFKITDGEETAITELKSKTSDRVMYDLTGRRVTKPTKGMYITNGKKILK